MRKIGLLFFAVLFMATNVMAGGSVEWNWNDETMGVSNFKRDFGTKKWTAVYFSIKNTADWYHQESCMAFHLTIEKDSKHIYSYSDEGENRKIWFGPGDGYEKKVELGNHYRGSLTVHGDIHAGPGVCGINTGRVRLHVVAYYE